MEVEYFRNHLDIEQKFPQRLPDCVIQPFTLVRISPYHPRRIVGANAVLKQQGFRIGQRAPIETVEYS